MGGETGPRAVSRTTFKVGSLPTMNVCPQSSHGEIDGVLLSRRKSGCMCSQETTTRDTENSDAVSRGQDDAHGCPRWCAVTKKLDVHTATTVLVRELKPSRHVLAVAETVYCRIAGIAKGTL